MTPVRAVLTTVLAVTLLAGCAPKSVARDSYPGAVPGAPQSEGVIGEEGPVAVWLDEGESFAVTTFGSSSCPPVPTGIEQTATDAVIIRLERASTTVCTADMAPTTHEFVLAEATDDRPVTVTLSWESSDEETELRLE